VTDGVAVVGAGRIGLPWAAVLAADLGVDVTCLDLDEERVDAIERADSPFAEPSLDDLLTEAVDAGRLRATTDPTAVRDHEYVALTINAPRNDTSGYVDAVETYADLLREGQTVVSRSTLPVEMVSRTREIVRERAGDGVAFTVFPERLAEGKAVAEIRSLPKIVGVDDEAGERAMRALLEPLDCPVRVTTPETAMLVKLIDNAYRDAVFAVANQIAYTADQLGLDAHEAIDLANRDYPRNDIPTPGTVGGKCLPKDPHFLMDEWVCDQPTTPDLFNATRRTNAYLPSYVATAVVREQPSRVAVLGMAYKSGVGDTFDSPAVAIAESVESSGVPVAAHDPQVPEFDGDLTAALDGADLAVLAVNHPEYEGIEPVLNETLPADGLVYDVWGFLDEEALDVAYDGYGIA
jgi:UDP-N-acetyl-D-mannosaminuronic acid dehydrogenase